MYIVLDGEFELSKKLPRNELVLEGNLNSGDSDETEAMRRL